MIVQTLAAHIWSTCIYCCTWAVLRGVSALEALCDYALYKSTFYLLTYLCCAGIVADNGAINAVNFLP